MANQKKSNDDYYQSSAWYDRLLNPLVNPIRQALVDWITIQNPKRVLDVCCGTGKQLSMLPENIEAVGIDVSDSMLEQAEKQAKGRCMWGDATNIPFEDGEFDLVISQFALHEKDTETIQAELMEVCRVLKADGMFSITDFDFPSRNSVISRFFGWGIRQIEKLAGGEHFENYITWMKRGGLNRIMINEGWTLIKDTPFYMGNIRLTFWKNS